MSKDSQIDPKQVSKKKNKHFMESKADNGTNNAKKQSGNRHKPGNDK